MQNGATYTFEMFVAFPSHFFNITEKRGVDLITSIRDGHVSIHGPNNKTMREDQSSKTV